MHRTSAWLYVFEFAMFVGFTQPVNGANNSHIFTAVRWRKASERVDVRVGTDDRASEHIPITFTARPATSSAPLSLHSSQHVRSVMSAGHAEKVALSWLAEKAPRLSDEH